MKPAELAELANRNAKQAAERGELADVRCWEAIRSAACELKNRQIAREKKA